ncbi:hypothetical protein V5O48_004233 [Marasmius crinis-equi]|uniref:Uncharacterized protein n=1 Tax=Marasmius crinis-equi TaxID=585013 RepID=A0ABR3FQN3_9AGAR
MDTRCTRYPPRWLISRVAAGFVLSFLFYLVICSYAKPTSKSRATAQRLSSLVLLKAIQNALDEQIPHHLPATNVSRPITQWNYDDFQSTGSWAFSYDNDLQCLLDTQAWIQINKSRPFTLSQSPKLCTMHTSLNVISSASQLCPLLAGKRILLVGPETSFHLHMNWLHDLELHENRSHTCLGPEYCTYHQICLPTANESEPFSEKGGFKKLPGTRELVATSSAILRYALSNTLYAKGTRKDSRYTDSLIQVDPATGVRMRDSYWMGKAKKSDVVILNRGPLPAPSQTYDGTPIGNWSFLQNPTYDLTYMERKTQHATISDVLPKDRDKIEHRLVVAALYTTLNTFLPSVLETIRILRSDRLVRDKLLLWHGSWFIQPSCLSPRETGILMNSEDALFASLEMNDNWLLYHNAQGDIRSPLPMTDPS